MDLIKEVTDTWEINNRITMHLLNAIEENWLADLPASKGRNIGEQFAHIHNARLTWLKKASPDLCESLSPIEEDKKITKEIVELSLKDSSNSICKLLELCINQGKMKVRKPPPITFLGYIIAHEAHHRGQIMIHLKENSRLSDNYLGMTLWHWGDR